MKFKECTLFTLFWYPALSELCGKLLFSQKDYKEIFDMPWNPQNLNTNLEASIGTTVNVCHMCQMEHDFSHKNFERDRICEQIKTENFSGYSAEMKL
jgi:heterodisulfide reductase subunit B